MSDENEKKLNIKQFTLIELIIVIVVIGLLAGMALPKFIGVERDSKVAAMDQDLDVLEKAVQLYNSDKGEYPLKATKITISDQNLKSTLTKVNDDGSQVYEIDMDKIQSYLEKLKFTDPTTDTYLYSTKTGVAIYKQGKIDSNENIHYILNNSISSKNIQTMFTSTNGVFSLSSFLANANGEFYAWGENNDGQLCNGTSDTNPHSIPTKIILAGGVSVIKIASGEKHTLAIGSDGELYTCGFNGFGQVGRSGNSYIPAKVTLANGVKPKEIACGKYHSMAIGDDGNLYSWGYNWSGQVGDGTTTQRNTPTKVILPSGIKPIQISGGESHSMAICNDGNLYAWGRNNNGQLGDGTNVNKLIPTKSIFPNGVKAKRVSLGLSVSTAIGDDGELYTWGDDSWLQCGGIGSGTTPRKATLASGVKPTQLSCGPYHVMAIGDDGNLYTWGNSQYGQLGNGMHGISTGTSIPQKIVLPDEVKPKQIACGNSSSMVIGNDNNLYAWGWNCEGQLGDGTTIDKYTPTKINLKLE